MRVQARPVQLQAGDVIIGPNWTVKYYGGNNGQGAHGVVLAGGEAISLTDAALEVERPVAPEAIVVDTTDAYVFSAPGSGIPFSTETAREFRDKRNAEIKVPTYKVYRLELVED
jgi:gentisate 1,2-dioxygenase